MDVHTETEQQQRKQRSRTENVLIADCTLSQEVVEHAI
jgi:hypothetical protein